MIDSRQQPVFSFIRSFVRAFHHTFIPLISQCEQELSICHSFCHALSWPRHFSRSPVAIHWWSREQTPLSSQALPQAMPTLSWEAPVLGSRWITTRRRSRNAVPARPLPTSPTTGFPRYTTRPKMAASPQ